MARQHSELTRLSQQISDLMRTDADARASEHRPLLDFLAANEKVTLFLLIYQEPGTGEIIYSLHTRQELQLVSGIPAGYFHKVCDRLHVLSKTRRVTSELAARGWL